MNDLSKLIKELKDLLTSIRDLLKSGYDIRDLGNKISQQFYGISQLWFVQRESNQVISNVKEILLKEENKLSNKEICRDIIQRGKDTVSIAEVETTKFGKLLENFETPERLLSEVSKNQKIHQNTMLHINNLRRALINLRNRIEELKSYYEDLFVQKTTFKGRTVDSYVQKLKTLIQDLEEISSKIKDFERDLWLAIVSLSNVIPSDNPREISHILAQLITELERGLWCTRLVNIITGLEGISGKLTAESVTLDIDAESSRRRPTDEDRRLSVSEIFYRFPPFEPIATEELISIDKNIKIPVSGSNIWFIIAKNLVPQSKRFLKSLISDPNEILILGESLERGNLRELKNVRTFNVLKEMRQGELYLKIILESSAGKRRLIRIKYGSRKLKDLILGLASSGKMSPHELEKAIQQSYENFLTRVYQKRPGKAYRATNLSYVWYCRLGFAMSTDPWDIDCPFKAQCRIYMSAKRKDRCPLWSVRRRIFPKVFSIIERKVSGLNIPENISGILRPISAYRVFISEVYKGVQWRMPTDFGDGPPVRVIFEQGILRSLPQTNVVGFMIPYDLIRRIIMELLDPNVTPKPVVDIFIGGTKKQVTLDKILLTKYFIWSASDSGMRLYGLLSKRADKLKDEYKNFLKSVQSDPELLNNVVKFGIEILGHSLAHLLWTFLANRLELEYEDLMYITWLDESSKMLLVLIAENSPLGVLDIVKHANYIFNGLDNMVNEFIKEISKLLDEHAKTLETYSYQLASFSKKFKYAKNQDIKKFIDLVKQYYEKNFLDNDLIIDHHIFALHLILSEEYVRIGKQANLDDITALSTLGTALDFGGPIYCLDGCASCIIIERGCTDVLMQNIRTSRCLVMWFLDVLFSGKKINAIGGRLGSTLLKTLTKHSLIAISPYLDDNGAELLSHLAKNGIKTILVTKEETFRKFKKLLNNVKVYLTQKPRHDKLYLIDDRILVESSWNLMVDSPSTESFYIKTATEEDKNSIRQILENSRRIS
ncbi:MAG: hypothetical protein ACTSXX_12365 [Candidatus Baldrarchaeia archaeon]